MKVKKLLASVLAVSMLSSIAATLNISAADTANNYKTTPVLNETFDSGALKTEHSGWGNQWIEETFADETGRGKVWTIPFGTGMANAAVNGAFSSIGQYMTGSLNYVKFDFKAENAYNFSFQLMGTEADTRAPIQLSTSRHGWMYANNFDSISQAGLDGNETVLDSNSKEMINAAEWRNGSEAINFTAGNWYSVMFVIDKVNTKIKIYVDDKFMLERTVPADTINALDMLHVWNHYSESDTSVSRFMTFDNFQVGTCTEQIAAEKLTLSEDGKLTVTYSGKVVGATFTASNVVIKKDGEGVSYNGSYDSETYTYTATIANFDPYADYTVSIKGITGFGGKPVQEVEKTFKGVKYLFSPVLTDTYDDGTATFDWQPDWSPSTTYVDETGRGKVAAVTFKEENKDSTTETNIVLTELSQYMTSDVNYISFDIKPAQLMNMSFSPTDVTNVVYPLTLFSSENGWFWGSGSRIPTQYGDDLPTIYGNTRATLVGWGFSASSFADTEVGKWYNVKFIMDKKNGKIAVYVDDVKLDEVSASATELSSIDRLLVRDCSASKTGPNMYIDNFQIGAAFPAPSKDTSITLVDASGNAITNGTTAAEVYPKAVINNTGKEAGSVQLSVASYDADGVLLDVKVETVTVAAGEIKTVTSSYGVKTQGTKTVKAFLWSGWSNITPLVGADVKTVNN